jgi:endonuclease G
MNSNSKLMQAIICLSFLMAAVSSLSARAQSCPENFAGGRAPAYTVASYSKNTMELCNDGYAVLYSGQTKTPLWSAEYLTPERVSQAKNQKRDSAFKEDGRVPYEWRSLLSDYVHSGMDRGHMSPSGDMPNQQAQAQSFYLTNMIPQNSNNNRGTWAGIESAVREYAKSRPIYVVTGPLFIGQQIGFLNGRVAVPTHLYKLVYDPASRRAAAYLVANQADPEVGMISVAALAQQSKLDFGLGNVEMLVLPTPGRGFHQYGKSEGVAGQMGEHGGYGENRRNDGNEGSYRKAEVASGAILAAHLLMRHYEHRSYRARRTYNETR